MHAVQSRSTRPAVSAPPSEKTQSVISLKRLGLSALLTSAGFFIAIVGNLLFPQVAAGIKTPVYQVGGLAVDLNGFYRLVLLTVILIYLLAAVRAVFDPSRREKYGKQARFRFAMGILLLAYDIAGTKLRVTPQPFFPGPAQILETFLIDTEQVWINLLYSLRLFSAGFLSGVVLGVGTGILIGWFPRAYYWIYPVLRMTGVIPAVAWMPFALTMLPTPFWAATFLIAICSWFPVASQTAFGIKNTPRTQFEAARTLGAKTPFLVFRVAVPNAMPQIFTGVTTACASSFTCLVMAEMMGQPGGLGYYINVVKVWAAYYKVFATILVMAILFSLILAVLNAVKAYVLRWQRGQFV
ncbi:MAG: ABC transporter permease subunit [Clostridia bacterium]|nr:ABC transporter permease subunit [Clostridia bacterium]